MRKLEYIQLCMNPNLELNSGLVFCMMEYCDIIAETIEGMVSPLS